MCGIAGYVGSRWIDDGRVEACLASMRHRGPDGSGVYRHAPAPGRHVLLLHARLAIRDLDARAAQPMRHGAHVIACNGELYNDRELRRGARDLRTTCDTEVLLRVLAREGLAGLDACEGMWALALYDELAGRLALVRDRLGQKPLWLHETRDGLLFASEIKQIHALLGREQPVDGDQIRRLLVHGYRALHVRPGSFFAGIAPLAPGTARVVDRAGRATDRRYWTPGGAEDPALGFDDAVERTAAALRASVARRLRADVPLAFLLSGGVDSAALVALAAERGHDVRAFTLRVPDERYDESARARATARALGVRHETIELPDASLLEDLPALVRAHDAPAYTITSYATWRLMQAIAGTPARVVITGTGADELFSGYWDHHLAYLHDVRGDPPAFEAALDAWRRHVRPLVRNPRLREPLALVRDPSCRAHLRLDAPAFAAMLREPWDEPFRERSCGAGLLRTRLLNELLHETVPAALHEEDLNAMSCSLENRAPLLDRAVCETSWTIPTRWLVRDGRAKAVLRAALRGAAPDDVLDDRHKIGFNAPIDALLDRRDPGTRAALLDDGPIFEIVRRDAVEALVDAEGPLPNSRSKLLFSLLSARLFLDQRAGARRSCHLVDAAAGPA